MAAIRYGLLILMLASAALVGPRGLSPASADGFDEGLRAFLEGDHDRARQTWLPLAERGDEKAQYGLGMMLETARGAPANAVQAAAWYRRAAEQGHAAAQLSLGSLYEHGRGVERSIDKAVLWYQRAAEQNDPQAQFNLAMAYLGGLGARSDQEQGIAWLRRAAAQGYSRAVVRLAKLGVTPDSAVLASNDSAALAVPEVGPVVPLPKARPARATPAMHALEQTEPVASGLVTVDATWTDLSDATATAASSRVEPAITRQLATLSPEPLEPSTAAAPRDITSGFAVRLESFRSEADALVGWRALTARYPILLGGLSAVVRAVELGAGNATFFRLEAGPLRSERAAVSLCASLRRYNQYCFAIRS
jgi:TPR repeat protein